MAVNIAGRIVAIAAAGLGVVAAPAAPVVTNVGTAGSTEYDYQVVSVDSKGNHSLPSPIGSTLTGNATLSNSNYNHLAWTATAGAASQLILRAGQLLTTLTGTAATLDDKGAFTPAAYAPTFAPTATLNVLVRGGEGAEQGGFVTLQIASTSLEGFAVGACTIAVTQP